MYDLGFPPQLQINIAQKFNSSMYAKYLVSYRPPHRVVNEFGFKVRLVYKILTTMHGSRETHTAYFYCRDLASYPLSQNISNTVIRVPGRIDFKESDHEVYCDPMFVEASILAVGKMDSINAHATDTQKTFLTSKRPRRETKPVDYKKFL